jgi:hypothetical protein
MTFEFTFTTRETYLAYKEDWKQRYAEQAKTQRQLKLAIREKMRENGWPYQEQWDYITGVSKVKKLLEERAASKVEAARQWQAARQPA